MPAAAAALTGRALPPPAALPSRPGHPQVPARPPPLPSPPQTRARRARPRRHSPPRHPPYLRRAPQSSRVGGGDDVSQPGAGRGGGGEHPAVSMATGGRKKKNKTSKKTQPNNPNHNPSRPVRAAPQSAAGAIPLNAALGRGKPVAPCRRAPAVPAQRRPLSSLPAAKPPGEAAAVGERSSQERATRAPPREMVHPAGRAGAPSAPWRRGPRCAAASGDRGRAAPRSPPARGRSRSRSRSRSPPASRPAVELQGKRRGGALLAGHALAAPFASCHRPRPVWKQGGGCAEPQPRVSVSVPHAGASHRRSQVWASLRGAGQPGLRPPPPPPEKRKFQHLHCGEASKGTFHSFASVPAGFRLEALLTNFVDTAFRGIQLPH